MVVRTFSFNLVLSFSFEGGPVSYGFFFCERLVVILCFSLLV